MNGLPPPVDLAAYFRRIGYGGATAPSFEVLESLCLSHVGTIPFENLDPLRGVPVSLDLPALQAKLVHGRRGGYCFEQNLLFSEVLAALGFAVKLRDARVRYRVPPGVTTARTHGALEVTLYGRKWLVDVGFGADGLLGPVPLDGAVVERHGERWRLLGDGPGLLLQADFGGGWTDYYQLQPGPVHAVDWAVANHYCATHPDSRFRRILTVQTSAPGNRRLLRGRTLMERGREGAVTRDLAPEEVLPVLRSVFGLPVPDAFLPEFANTYNEAG